ncbi:MAG: ArsC/Spx/MgsR family protein [Micromonosporaceae bacterium]
MAGLDFGIRRYLEQPPTPNELDDVLTRLGRQPWQVARLGEPVASELGLADWPRDDASRGRWIDAMAAHPELIQRPILLFDDGRALLGRTPESLDEAVRESGAS